MPGTWAGRNTAAGRIVATGRMVAIVLGLALSTALAPSGARACGLDGANEAMLLVQRAYMGWRYPAIRAIPDAVKAASGAGLLASPAKATGGPFALHRSTIQIKDFSKRIEAASADAKARFTLLLLEPMLWTVVEPLDNGMRYEFHAAGPTAGAPIVVTEAAVIAALLKGTLSAESAQAGKLLRLEGKAAHVEALQRALRTAYPPPVDDKASELAGQ